MSIVFLLVLSGIVFPQTQEQERAKIKLYQDAFLAPTPSERILRFNAIIEKWPDFLNARYALGYNYTVLGRHDKAIVHFNYLLDRPEQVNNDESLKETVDIATIKSLVAFAYFQIGSDFLRANETTPAISAFQHAIRLENTNSRYLSRLGDVYMQVGKYNSAIEFYLESLTIGDQSASVWNNLGSAYWQTNSYEAAKDAYKKCLEIAPDMQEARNNLQRINTEMAIPLWRASGDSALAAGNPELALDFFQRIVQADPSDADTARKINELQNEAVWQNAIQAERRGNLDEALRLIAQLPAGYKESARMKRDLQTAIDRQRQEKKREQRNRRLDQQANRAENAFSDGDYEKAEGLIKSVLRDDPRHEKAKQVKAALAIARQAQEETEQQKPPEPDPEMTPEIPSSLPGRPAQVGSTAVNPNEENEPVSDHFESPEQKLSNEAMLAFIGLFLAAGVMVFFFISRRRKTAKARAVQQAAAPGKNDYALEVPENARASHQVAAAVEKLDIDELYQKNRKQPPDAAGTQEFFENLISDDMMRNDEDSVEIYEIKPDELNEKLVSDVGLDIDDSEKEPKPPRPGRRSTGSRDGSHDSFMNLVDNDQPTPPPFRETTDGDLLTGGDRTHTLDMSQYKVRKIGRFVIEKEIGRGAAGRIYKAWDPKLDRTVVIKTVSYNLTANAEEIERLKERVYREARAAAKLNQPNIVVVYDVDDESTFSYIVMEHIEGLDLRELLENEKKLSPERCVNFVIQICKALSFAHQAGIVHRDVKPSNVLVLTSDKIKVTDFGIAKLTNHLTLTQTGRVVGTPSYMAPEQIEGQEVDARADIFSLGVVFYEILTGQRPFTGDTLAALAYKIVHVDPTPPSLVNIELSPLCDEIIGKAIAKDPEQRYQEITDFQRALENARNQMIIQSG